jgi:hypothetical protein
MKHWGIIKNNPEEVIKAHQRTVLVSIARNNKGSGWNLSEMHQAVLYGIQGEAYAAFYVEFFKQ